MRGHSPKAFTLIELLVVISIIALLVAILLPALAKARISAQMAGSLSQIRQIAITHHTYAHDNKQSLIYLSFDETGNAGNQRPVWAAALLRKQYLPSAKVFWSPGRDTSQLAMHNAANNNYTDADPWFYTGYGMNAWITSSQRNSNNPLFDDTNNLHHPTNLSHPRVPPHGKFLLMAERSTDGVSSGTNYQFPNTLPGFYHVSASTNISDANNLFTYNGGAVHVYLDGHGSSDSLAVGWIPSSKFVGRWVYTSPGNRDAAPWNWRWWHR